MFIRIHIAHSIFKHLFGALTLIALLTHSGALAQNNSTNLNSKTEALLEEVESLVSTKPLDAITHAQIALHQSKQTNNLLAYSTGLKLIGTAYFYLGQYDSTKWYWTNSKNCLLPIGGLPLADAYNNLGIIYQRTGLQDSSLYFHNQSLVIRTKHGDSLGIADSYSNMASIYRSAGAFEKSLDLYFRSLKIYQAQELAEKESDALNNVGLVYIALENYSQALSYLQESLDLKLILGNDRKIASTLTNIATAYMKLGDYAQAEKLLLESKSIYEKYNDIRNLAGISSNLGILYKELGENEKAIAYYLLAEKQLKAIGDKHSYCAVKANIAGLFYILQDYDQAATYYEESHQIAGELKSLPLLLTANLGLAKTYEKKGDFERAMKHNSEYVQINDSLFRISMGERIAELSEGYEAEKKARKITELEAKSLLIAKSNQFKKFVIWVIATTAIIVVLTLLVIVSRIQFRRKILTTEKEQYRLSNELIKKDLEQKNRELTSYAGLTLQKSKFLQDLRDELDKIDFNKSEPSLVLSKLKKEIDSSIDAPDEWERFKIHFEGVHPSFFQKISSQYPHLTSNDLKYCAYIKLKMNSKEISVLMNISPKSAKMNKYRLKKKFNLPEDDSLDEFLANY